MTTTPAHVPVSDVVGLLAAIRDALDVPPPALGAEAAHYRILADRCAIVLAAARGVVREDAAGTAPNPAAEARIIRRALADTPVTYTPLPMTTAAHQPSDGDAA